MRRGTCSTVFVDPYSVCVKQLGGSSLLKGECFGVTLKIDELYFYESFLILNDFAPNFCFFPSFFSFSFSCTTKAGGILLAPEHVYNSYRSHS